MSTRTVVTAVLLIASLSVWSYEPKQARAMSNFTLEMIECGAYFAISSVAIRRSGDNSLADDYKIAANNLLQRTLPFSNKEAVKARYKLAVEEQLSAIENNFSNISILIHRYTALCDQVNSDPAARMEYWRGRKD